MWSPFFFNMSDFCTSSSRENSEVFSNKLSHRICFVLFYIKMKGKFLIIIFLMTFDKYSSKRAPDLKTSNCSEYQRQGCFLRSQRSRISANESIFTRKVLFTIYSSIFPHDDIGNAITEQPVKFLLHLFFQRHYFFKSGILFK